MRWVVKNTSDYQKIFDSLLERIELRDETGLTLKQKKLRDRILYTHAKIEAKIENLIQDYFRHYTVWSADITIERDIYEGIGELLECMDYRDKLRACEKLNILDKDQTKLATKLNELRNKFAHQKAQTLSSYEGDEKFSQAIKTIIDSLIIFRVIVVPDKNK